MRFTYALLFTPLALVAASAVKQRDTPEDIGSAVGNGAAVVTSIATEVGDAASDGVKTLYKVVSEAGGEVKTVASKVVTNVESGWDEATSAADSAYHSPSKAAAMSAKPQWALSLPVVSSLAAMLGGVAAGAWVTL